MAISVDFSHGMHICAGQSPKFQQKRDRPSRSIPYMHVYQCAIAVLEHLAVPNSCNTDPPKGSSNQRQDGGAQIDDVENQNCIDCKEH